MIYFFKPQFHNKLIGFVDVRFSFFNLFSTLSYIVRTTSINTYVEKATIFYP